MNVSSCPGCGDTHLCAGSPATLDAGTGLVAQVARFVEDTFTRHATGVVNTSSAFEAYRDWCVAHETVGYSQKRFVQAMEAAGVRRVKRSTMRFAGITWKRAETRGRHAAPEMCG